MKKTILIVAIMLLLVGISSGITRADDTIPTHLSQTPELIDRGSFHLAKYKSDSPVKALGLVNNHLIASFSETEHAWFFQNTFKPVNGSDPAKALGYTSMQTSASLLATPKASLCAKFKDTISSITLTEGSAGKTLCLSSTEGGDFTLHILPAAKDNPISIGYGKYPILEKSRVSFVGYDGNLYIAYLHPILFSGDMSVVKTKTNPVVFLLRNGSRYSIPDEQTYYTWFDSFKSVSVVDGKKITTYPLQAKSGYRANTLIQFKGLPEIYVYQPANDPFIAFGKDIKIIEDQKDQWIIQKAKSKTTEPFLKRPELLRHATSPTDLLQLWGPSWSSRVLKLNADQKSRFTISDKDFDSTKDFIFE